MTGYKYENNQLIIQGYDTKKPFASFLPGIAGVDGIPMWVYYTNRGQGVAGFGVENKDGAIFDFVPANVAYKRTELQGFRTFLKINGHYTEAFSSSQKQEVERQMVIEPNAFGFKETNKNLGYTLEVTYFTTTGTSYPALIRKVSLVNHTGQAMSVEVVDGLMTMWPYKNDNAVIKNMANLAVAWFDVEHSNLGVPMYKNRSTTSDSAEVGTVEAAHFYASYTKDHQGVLPMIYDTEVLFGHHTGLLEPQDFITHDLVDLLKVDQVPENKMPCAFTCYTGQVDHALTFYSVVGRVDSKDHLETISQAFSETYFETLENKAKNLAEDLLSDVATTTAYPLFDAYVKQCYLDNFLRGGYPLVFEGKEGPLVYHVYSRIHGDMEREYNDFYVEPAYYSHGIGNFRDVNQNRRNDVFIEKDAGLFNIVQFMELLQVDGQNPLSIQGSRLIVDHLDPLLDLVVDGRETVQKILSQAFTPGALVMALKGHQVSLSVNNHEFLQAVFKAARQENQAAYGHGFWVDHWTYNMDLVDNFLDVYPDRLEELLYQTPIKAFKSPEVVLPRKDKYVVTKEGKVRQYDALRKAKGHQGDQKWLCDAQGKVYRSTIFERLLTLAINKVTNFDPSGLGIMMNSDKPGWNDAMNGLPGLFGSGTSEVIEIKRIIDFLSKGFKQVPRAIKLPKEVSDLLAGYMAWQEGPDQAALSKWEALQTLKEAYLETIEASLEGTQVTYTVEQVSDLLTCMQNHLKDRLDHLKQTYGAIMPSYFVHEAMAFIPQEGHLHPVNGMQTVKVTEWQARPIPLYLEAPARYLKQLKDESEARDLYHAIKKSGMYDEALGMYVTSESLDEETFEIGRARAFTAGWLERESVFMHMSYKYLLGLLKAGLYEEFYEAVKTSLPPFMDPEVYGRSTLENSSFIASSRNPNPKNHGRGFVSRLTGTTSEMLSMWMHMMTGTHLFAYDDTLKFELSPKLPADFFDANNRVTTHIFKDVEIDYYNPKKKATFGSEGVSPQVYGLHYKDGQIKQVMAVEGQDAYDVRNGLISRIVVTLG